MTAVDNYGGQRFREPIDWTLLVLASVLVAGQWQRPRRVIYISCLVVALAFGWSALKTVPDSLLARADYGIAPWNYNAHARTTIAEASTGLNVFPVDDRMNLFVKSLDAGASMPVESRSTASISNIPLLTAADIDSMCRITSSARSSKSRGCRRSRRSGRSMCSTIPPGGAADPRASRPPRKARATEWTPPSTRTPARHRPTCPAHIGKFPSRRQGLPDCFCQGVLTAGGHEPAIDARPNLVRDAAGHCGYDRTSVCHRFEGDDGAALVE